MELFTMVVIDLPVLPPRLYRYRSVDTIKLAKQEFAAIAKDYLWCSDYRDLNDPMEGFYGTSPWMARQTNYEKLAKEIVYGKRHIGICCLSDTFENELMWTHYAGNYSGICIAYSTSQLCSGLDDKVHIVRVAYNDEPPRIGRDYSNSPQQAARAILSHKKTPWLYEREWRLLAASDALSAPRGRGSRPPPGRLQMSLSGSVKKVYLGSRMKSDVKNMLKMELCRLKIPIQEMKVSGYVQSWAPVR